MNGTNGMSTSQKKEMRRRTILFLYYFIRTPLYDNYTRFVYYLFANYLFYFDYSKIRFIISSLINVTLTQFEQNIPLIKYLISMFYLTLYILIVLSIKYFYFNFQSRSRIIFHIGNLFTTIVGHINITYLFIQFMFLYIIYF